jgi:hypothetical protein
VLASGWCGAGLHVKLPCGADMERRFYVEAEKKKKKKKKKKKNSSFQCKKIR